MCVFRPTKSVKAWKRNIKCLPQSTAIWRLYPWYIALASKNLQLIESKLTETVIICNDWPNLICGTPGYIDFKYLQKNMLVLAKRGDENFWNYMSTCLKMIALQFGFLNNWISHCFWKSHLFNCWSVVTMDDSWEIQNTVENQVVSITELGSYNL